MVSAATTPFARLVLLGVLCVRAHAFQDWCQAADKAVRSMHWDVDVCKGIDWVGAALSVENRRLVYAEFGQKDSPNTTLILATVHGDEVTPFFVALKLTNWLRDHKKEIGQTRVIVAPLVNPDGFYRPRRTRMNARGVDINRNFKTHDWELLALRTWREKYRQDPRRFPGYTPRSEPETLFQEELIKQFKPQKILAIHSPLNMLDYDGPSEHLTLSQFPKDYRKQCERLKTSLRAKSTGYFPGSLGNYSGRELGIPTLTLELPSADAKQAMR